MKRIGAFFIGLAAATAIVFWSRERAPAEKPVVASASSRVPIDRPKLELSGSSEGQQTNSLIGPSSGTPMDDTLALIRQKLVQLSETTKADKGTEDELMTGLLAMLTDDNAAEITRALSIDELGSRFGLAALQRWLEIDVSAAADWIVARSDVTDDQAWAVAHQLVQTPRALEFFCDQLTGNPRAQIFLKNAGLEAVGNDPVEAINLARRMNPGSAQTSLLQTAAYVWMIGNPRAASGWILQVPDPLLKEQLVCAAAKAHAAANPLQAVEWLISAVPAPWVESEERMDDTLQSIIGIWVETKPAQVAELVAGFSNGNMRAATVDLVSRRWLQLDPSAATAWVKTLPEGNKILAGYRPQ